MLVRNVFHEQPSYVEGSLPLLLLRPRAEIRVEVKRGSHLGNATELAALVYTEEQKYWIISILEGVLISCL